MTRNFKRGLCRVLACAFLFAQIAIAAHACPMLTAASPPVSQAEAQPPCHPVPASPSSLHAVSSLCGAHCQFGDQSADASQLPAVPAMLPAGFQVVSLPSDRSSAPWRPASPVPVAASPPHTLLHCCFRI